MERLRQARKQALSMVTEVLDASLDVLAELHELSRELAVEAPVRFCVNLRTVADILRDKEMKVIPYSPALDPAYWDPNTGETAVQEPCVEQWSLFKLVGVLIEEAVHEADEDAVAGVEFDEKKCCEMRARLFALMALNRHDPEKTLPGEGPPSEGISYFRRDIKTLDQADENSQFGL